MAAEVRLEGVLDRLAWVLREKAADVWESLRAPVTDADLQVLRGTIAPYEIPEDLVTLLRWADGQAEGALRWPSMECGPLLSARRAAEHYTWLRANVEDWQSGVPQFVGIWAGSETGFACKWWVGGGAEGENL